MMFGESSEGRAISKARDRIPRGRWTGPIATFAQDLLHEVRAWYGRALAVTGRHESAATEPVRRWNQMTSRDRRRSGLMCPFCVRHRMSGAPHGPRSCRPNRAVTPDLSKPRRRGFESCRGRSSPRLRLPRFGLRKPTAAICAKRGLPRPSAVFRESPRCRGLILVSFRSSDGTPVMWLPSSRAARDRCPHSDDDPQGRDIRGIPRSPARRRATGGAWPRADDAARPASRRRRTNCWAGRAQFRRENQTTALSSPREAVAQRQAA
jgi:hypothetical protein